MEVYVTYSADVESFSIKGIYSKIEDAKEAAKQIAEKEYNEDYQDNEICSFGKYKLFTKEEFKGNCCSDALYIISQNTFPMRQFGVEIHEVK